MASEVIRKKIYDAATQGDVTKFQEVVEDDPYILDVVSFAGSRTVLHIATLWGKMGIVEEVLKINPRLARSLDSEKKSALHLAAGEEGAVGIASKLVSIAPAMCWLRDCHGMNPVHIAAMNGHAEVLEELIREDPLPAREKVDRGQTVMHLCVKHGQLRAFKVLENRLGELVFLEDDDGETLLHLAIKYKQVEIVRYLTENSRIKVQLMNSKGKTAMEISRESRGVDATYYSEIRKVLMQQTKVNAKDLFRTENHVVIVLVIMIAEMAFQSMISPPGGVWQDDSSTHEAGKAILASNDPERYEAFVMCNTLALTSSLLIISLFMSVPNSSTMNSSLQLCIGFGSEISLSAFYVSYMISVVALTPSPNMEAIFNLIPSIFWRPAMIAFLGLGIISCLDYFVTRILTLMERICVACGGIVVIRNYCVRALLKLSSLIDKYVRRLDGDSNA